MTAPRLAAFLAENRAWANAQFERVRVADEKRAERFTALLRDVISPILERAVAAGCDTDAVARALISVGCRVLGAGPLASEPTVSSVWISLLPQLAAVVARDPERVTAAVTNLHYNVLRTAGADVTLIGPRLVAVAGLTEDVDAFLSAGRVIAWTAGMAHHRGPALEALARLPAPLAEAALGIPLKSDADVATCVAALRENPWRDPSGVLTSHRSNHFLVRRGGNFRGLGGPFTAPPTVAHSPAGLAAHDGVTWWAIHADIFNVVLTPTTGDVVRETATDDPHLAISGTSAVTRDGRRMRVTDRDDVSGWAACGATAVVTYARSFRFSVIGDPR